MSENSELWAGNRGAAPGRRGMSDPDVKQWLADAIDLQAGADGRNELSPIAQSVVRLAYRIEVLARLVITAPAERQAPAKKLIESAVNTAIQLDMQGLRSDFEGTKAYRELLDALGARARIAELLPDVKPFGTRSLEALEEICELAGAPKP